MRIRDTASIAKKFTQRAAAAAPEYKTGVEQSGQDWATNTAAAGDNYQQGVQQALADRRFEKGVQAAGPAKFVQRASTMGAQRFAPGVQNAEADYAKGVAPYLDALKGMQLPPRGAKGDPRNYQRSQAVAQRLRDIRVAR